MVLGLQRFVSLFTK